MQSETELSEFIAEEFEDSGMIGNTGLEKISTIDMERLSAAENTMKGVTLNPHIIDIYKDATNIRNVLGDMEGYANEISQNIRSNVLVLASILHRKPWRLVIDALRTMPTEEAVKLAEKTVSELNEFIAKARS